MNAHRKRFWLYVQKKISIIAYSLKKNHKKHMVSQPRPGMNSEIFVVKVLNNNNHHNIKGYFAAH